MCSFLQQLHQVEDGWFVLLSMKLMCGMNEDVMQPLLQHVVVVLQQLVAVMLRLVFMI